MHASTDLAYSESRMDLDHLKQLIERNEDLAFGKFVGDTNLSKEYLATSLAENVIARLSKGDVIAEALWEKRTERTVGVVVAEEAKWDTEHFGHRMGKITLALFDEEVGLDQRAAIMGKISKKVMAKMMSARISLADLKTIQALERMGAILTDVLLTYRFDFAKWPSLAYILGTKIGPAREDEAKELAHIGSGLFTIDRFHGDSNLSAAKSNELYSKWVLNSVNGSADAVLVARDGDQVAGFITCKVQQLGSAYKFGIIDLVGVRPSFAGLGIGQELVRSALKWFSGRVPSVYVGTQAANTRAVRLYESSRFTYATSEATLHLWSGSYAGGVTHQ